MAAEPVSPLVAPMTVRCSLSRPVFPLFLRTRKYSKRLPRNCSATSLKANVGPWKSSSKCMFFFSSSVTVGVTSLVRNVE